LNVSLNPLVSIIINNYNYGDFLDDAINSALLQTHQNCEVIVVDDGSTDKSREIIEKYQNNITSIFKENGGQSSALNVGFRASKGEIICFLDSDDEFCSDKVHEVFQRFHESQDIEWCFHTLKLIDLNRQEISPDDNYRLSSLEWDFRKNILNGERLPYIHSATTGLSFRRSLLEKIFPIPEVIKITSDNYLKLTATALAKGFFISQGLALQKIHGNNAYTLKSHRSHLEAEVLVRTAYGIRLRFPFLSKTADGLLALGISMFLRFGGVDVESKKVIHNYFLLVNLIEKFNIKIKVFYCWFKCYGLSQN
jgi:glycosyltransferase involved in cell wall biosynthesis